MGLCKNVMPKYEQFLKEYRAMSIDKIERRSTEKKAGQEMKQEDAKALDIAHSGIKSKGNGRKNI